MYIICTRWAPRVTVIITITYIEFPSGLAVSDTGERERVRLRIVYSCACSINSSKKVNAGSRPLRSSRQKINVRKNDK
jgi:hypothetical protein